MSSPIKRLPKWLDRAGFEADKLMRANRVRTEVTRIGQAIDNKIQDLGEKALELEAEGVGLDPALQMIANEIKVLRAELQRKDVEVQAIHAESWSENGPVQQPTTGHDPIAQRLQAFVEANANEFNCPKCGALVRANKRFCPRCGRRVLR